MSSPRPLTETDTRLLHWIPGLLALVVLWRVGSAWASRLFYPFDLEWMEGGMLAHAWRMQRGLSVYPDAGPDWMPYVYPPGYTAVLAALGWWDLDYPVGRAISIAGTLVAAACLVWAVGRRGGWGLGVVCAGIFLACYPTSGAFYDLVRPDGLAIGLLALSITVGIERWRRAPEVAGLLLFLAFTVKHHSAAFGFALVAGLWARSGWREALRFAVASAVPGLLFTVGVQWWTGGFFLDWLLGVPRSHPMIGNRIFPGTPMEIGQTLLVPLGLAAAAMVPHGGRFGSMIGALLLAVAVPLSLWMRQPVGLESHPQVAAACTAVLAIGLGAWISSVARRAPDWRLVLAGALGLVTWGVAGLMRGHNGGFVNVYIPLHWLIAAGFGFAVTRLSAWRPGWPMAGALAAIGVAQLGWQLDRLDLRRLIPTFEDRAAGNRVVGILRERCDGEILSPYAAWLPVQAGQPPSWHLIALWDIQHKTTPFRAGAGRIAAAARAHRWACVVEGGSPKIGVGIAENYESVLRFDLPGKVLQPKTGWRVRPNGLLVPKEQTP